MRAVLFGLVGAGFLAYWVVVDPGHEASSTMTEWPHVLGFSALLLALAVALPVLGRMVDAQNVVRWSVVAGAGSGVSSVANLLEDGVGVEWMIFVFVAGAAVLIFGLLALAVVIVRGRAVGRRGLALVPLGTAAGIMAFVVVGGPVMAATWLAAAVASLWRSSSPMPSRSAVRAT